MQLHDAEAPDLHEKPHTHHFECAFSQTVETQAVFTAIHSLNGAVPISDKKGGLPIFGPTWYLRVRPYQKSSSVGVG